MSPRGRSDLHLSRRGFIQRATLAGIGAGLVLRWAPASGAPSAGPYGPLSASVPDANGLLLPEGFTSRVVAISGDRVPGTSYPWPLFPGGAATFPDGEGGWFYACNSAVFDYLTPWVPMGGASAIHFDSYGVARDAYRILEGSHSNSRGGPTPWGTWLSCEEDYDGEGLVWECDPAGGSPAVALGAMGRRSHAGVAVDPAGRAAYLTEAHPAGLLYRYTPSAWPDLADGSLEAMVVDGDGGVSWSPVPDPAGLDVPARQQVPDAFVTPDGGGAWLHDGTLLFTTGLDNRVHSVDLEAGHHRLAWDGLADRQPLTGVGDLTVEPRTGDAYVAEERGDMEIAVIGPGGEVAPFCRFADPAHRFSAVTGPCFDPAGERLYFSSQRGPGNRLTREVIPDIDWGDAPEGLMAGITYEVTGPFRSQPVQAPASTAVAATTAAPTPSTALPPGTGAPVTAASGSADRPGVAPAATTTGPGPVPSPGAPVRPADIGGVEQDALIGLGAAAAALMAGAAVAVGRRRRRVDRAEVEPGDGPESDVDTPDVDVPGEASP